MNHQVALGVVIGSAIFAGMAGAFTAIFATLAARRRAGTTQPQSTRSFFVSAVLFAAMAGALAYQGISNSFPPDFVGVAIFLAGVLITFWMGWRRARA